MWSVLGAHNGDPRILLLGSSKGLHNAPHSTSTCLIKTRSLATSQLIVALCFFVISFLDLVLLLFIKIIDVLIVSLLASLSLSLGPFFLVLCVLHLLLSLLGDSPQGLSGSLGLSGVVCDHHVVENGAGFHLPQIEADLAVLCIFADVLGIVGVVLRVVNLWVHPWALVVGVVDLGRLPLTVHLIVPVLGLRRVGVSDVLGLVPVLWLDVLRVIELGLINPIIWLLCLGILNLLGRQEVPVV